MAATGSDLKGIFELNKLSEDRREEIALTKILKQQAKERKLQRPANISREVFALMTEEEILRLQEIQERQFLLSHQVNQFEINKNA